MVLCLPTFEAASFEDVVDGHTCHLWMSLVSVFLDGFQEDCAFSFLVPFQVEEHVGVELDGCY